MQTRLTTMSALSWGVKVCAITPGQELATLNLHLFFLLASNTVLRDSWHTLLVCISLYHLAQSDPSKMWGLDHPVHIEAEHALFQQVHY